MLKTFIFPHTKITIVTDTQYNNPYMYMSDHEPFNKMQFQQKPRFKRRDFFREGGGGVIINIFVTFCHSICIHIDILS